MTSQLPQLVLNSEKDNIFQTGEWPKPFQFNEDVARVFDDMVSRSVPLYHEVLIAAAHWARRYYQPSTRLIDVGCSTGTFLELIGRVLAEPAHLVGIDNSEAMLQKASDKLQSLQERHEINLLCRNAAECSFENCSVVVMNYTLQFLNLSDRCRLISSIFRGLVPGGLLFFSEKVRSASPQFQETITHHYEAFKETNGYAQTEIERKKEALEHVLVPLTAQEQLQMLEDAGFKQIDTLIKLHNFTTFVAQRS